jgi:hypothetical protein
MNAAQDNIGAAVKKNGAKFVMGISPTAATLLIGEKATSFGAGIKVKWANQLVFNS